jgi:hypothetical protein
MTKYMLKTQQCLIPEPQMPPSSGLAAFMLVPMQHSAMLPLVSASPTRALIQFSMKVTPHGF